MREREDDRTSSDIFKALKFFDGDVFSSLPLSLSLFLLALDVTPAADSARIDAGFRIGTNDGLTTPFTHKDVRRLAAF